MKYELKLDAFAQGITICVLIVLISIAAFIFYTFTSDLGLARNRSDLPNTKFVELIVLGISFIIVLFSAVVPWLFHPSGYRINENKLYIERPIGQRIFEISDITNVRHISENETNGLIRTFASGGYFGSFYNDGLGNSSFFTGRMKNLVLLSLKHDGNVVVSPENTEQFILSINNERIK